MPRMSKGTKSIGLLVISMALSLYLAAAEGDTCPPSYMFSQNERFGFGALGGVTQFDVGQLHAGWYVNWGTLSDLTHFAGLEFMQIIRVHGTTYYPSKAALEPVVENNPGLTWIIGNEPDCIWQDDTYPWHYAQVYHELYTFLKEKDPTCKVAIGGVVQATPLRLQYLDMVLSSYQSLYGQKMPVDVWNVHGFILRERKLDWGCEIPPGINAYEGEVRDVQDHDRMDIFRQQIRSFRQWMKDKGERDKPLIVTEYGILMPTYYGFYDGRVRSFMINTFNYFMTATDPDLGYPADGNRLVQRWAWYSLNDANFEGYDCRSNLFDPYTKAIRPLGQAYGDYTAPLVQPYVDLVPTDLSVELCPSPFYGEPVSMTLQSTVTNQGNTDTPQGFTVSFWLGDPNDSGVLIVADQVDGVSGQWGSATTDVIAANPIITAPSSVYVWVDSGSAIEELCEDNNQAYDEEVWSTELSLSSISFDPPAPFSPSGQPVTVTLQATVENEGRLGVKNVEVCFWNGDPEAGTLIVSDTIPSIDAHSSETAEFIWSNVDVGAHEVYVEVDPGDDFIESNEADNLDHKTLLIATSRGFLPIILKEHSN